MLSIGIIAGLIAMVCWGVADYYQALIVRKLGSIKYMFFSSLMTFVITLPLIIPFLAKGLILFNTKTIIILVIAGIIDIFAAYNFMRSMEIGEIAIVTPISAAYALVTVFLAFIFLGERLTFLQSLAIFVILIGIFLVSTDLKKLRHIHTTKGVKEALITTLLWGVFFLMLGLAKKQLIEYDKLAIAITLFFFTSIINSFLMASFAFLRKGTASLPDMKDNFLQVFIIFVLYTIAWAAYNYGFVSGMVSIVAPVSSLYPAITVIMAVVLLKEKLLMNQKIGAVFLLAGIFLLSF
ncbi:MAG: DMT family transporter [archaeon]